jgi:hypothetical protein
MSQMYSDGMCIVILQRGWVVVGDYWTDGEYAGIHGGNVIRVWGTSKGLGQLQLEGPTPSTILDPVGPMRWHVLSQVAVMPTDAALW